MSNVNWELYEDISMLESAYVLENESLLEAFIIPNKKKLDDPDYVNNLIKTINTVDNIEKDTFKIVRFIDKVYVVIMSLTIIGIPIALLMNALSKLQLKICNKITDFTSLKSFEKSIECMNKAIKDLEKQKSDANATEKAKIEKAIKQLEDNKVKMQEAMKKAEKRIKEAEDKKKKK